MLQQNIFQSLFSRFRRLSRGSVLILVIVLLLMLTILGTVYLSTSRAGRINSAQNLLNAQSDMHAEGIANAAAGAILDDLNSGGSLRFRIPVTAYSPQTVYVAGKDIVFDPNFPNNFYTCTTSGAGNSLYIAPPPVGTGAWTPLYTAGQFFTGSYLGALQGTQKTITGQPWLAAPPLCL